jgi:aquaporin Z
MFKPWSMYFAELIGTFLLVLMGVGTAVIGGPEIGTLGIALAFGLALTYGIGPISGCHINPAVTLSLAFGKRFPMQHVLPYIAMQLIGGILGAYAVYLIASGKIGFDVTKGIFPTGLGAHSPNGYSVQAGIMGEMAMTCILCFVALSATRSEFPAGFAGLATGFTLLAIHLLLIPVTNCSVNFARSLGSALFSGQWAVSQLWFFAAAQMTGAIVAALLNHLAYSQTLGKAKKA